jgi:hypothetical protein
VVAGELKGLTGSVLNHKDGFLHVLMDKDGTYVSTVLVVLILGSQLLTCLLGLSSLPVGC